MTVKRTTIELDEDLVRAAQAVTGDASDGRARAAAAGGRGCRAGRRAPAADRRPSRARRHSRGRRRAALRAGVAMTTWILDKSAHVRLVAGATPPAGIDLTDLAICDIGELEWLYSARSATDYDSQQTSLRAYQILRAPSDIFDRVRHLQRDLAHHRGMWHRTPLPDLFIAETALHHRAGVLHHDRDCKRIAVVRPGFQACELSRGR